MTNSQANNCHLLTNPVRPIGWATKRKPKTARANPWFRWATPVFLTLLTLSTGALALRSTQVEERLMGEREHLSDALARLGALEARVGAGRRVIADAAKSIVLLQGAYGFTEPETQRPLRYAGMGPDGQPFANISGEPVVTLDGDGPIAERFFVGTAFVVSDDGLLLTNRHVAQPWEMNAMAQAFTEQGLVPVMHRFVGYFADTKEPVPVELVVVSDEADLAVLRVKVKGHIEALTLSDAPPHAGDDVIVLGYPAGMRALLARMNDASANELISADDTNFWTVARRLSEDGQIRPLATRGIVGHVGTATVAYDAETTSGGSGGPVIGLNGEVMAVNTAILQDFDGSNLGVPAEQAQRLLTEARRNLPLRSTTTKDHHPPDLSPDSLVVRTASVARPFAK